MTASDDRAFFETFGYLHLPGLLAPVTQTIDDAFERCAGPQRASGARVSVANILARHPSLAALSFERPLRSVVASLLGDDFAYVGSTGQVFDGECTPWHSDDGAGRLKLPFRSLRVSMYLEPLCGTSGCLRVIPGSHHRGDRFADALTELLATGTATNRVEPSRRYAGRAGHQLPAVCLESTPGDVILFDANLKHGAFLSRAPRRLLSMTFVPRTGPEHRTGLRQLLAFTAHRNTLYGGEAREPVTPLLRSAAAGTPHLDALLANLDAYMAGCQIAEQQRAAAESGAQEALP